MIPPGFFLCEQRNSRIEQCLKVMRDLRKGAQPGEGLDPWADREEQLMLSLGFFEDHTLVDIPAGRCMETGKKVKQLKGKGPVKLLRLAAREHLYALDRAVQIITCMGLFAYLVSTEEGKPFPLVSSL